MPNLIAVALKLTIQLIAFVEKLVVSLLNVIVSLFGIHASAPRRALPSVSTRPPDLLAEVKNQTSATGAGFQKLLKPTTDAGHVLYRFAHMCPEQRASMDLSALTSEQQNWMLMLSDIDLARLASVGLDGCTRAMSGKRCGIVGLPLMRNEKPVETVQPTSILARRILAHKQASFN